MGGLDRGEGSVLGDERGHRGIARTRGEGESVLLDRVALAVHTGEEAVLGTLLVGATGRHDGVLDRIRDRLKGCVSRVTGEAVRLSLPTVEAEDRGEEVGAATVAESLLHFLRGRSVPDDGVQHGLARGSGDRGEDEVGDLPEEVETGFLVHLGLDELAESGEVARVTGLEVLQSRDEGRDALVHLRAVADRDAFAGEGPVVRAEGDAEGVLANDASVGPDAVDGALARVTDAEEEVRAMPVLALPGLDRVLPEVDREDRLLPAPEAESGLGHLLFPEDRDGDFLQFLVLEDRILGRGDAEALARVGPADADLPLDEDARVGEPDGGRLDLPAEVGEGEEGLDRDLLIGRLPEAVPRRDEGEGCFRRAVHPNRDVVHVSRSYVLANLFVASESTLTGI